MQESPQTGLLTFLFTDLEGSTALWEDFPELMEQALARHDSLLREVIEIHRGQVVKTTGDGFHAIFGSPTDGIAAALAGQQAIVAENWPEKIGQPRVRMGLHTGESQSRDGDYYGPEINRAARIMGIGHGGQVLVSEVCAALLKGHLPQQATLEDLGMHRLKGVTSPERIFQLQHPRLEIQFPPLKSLTSYPHNLPIQVTSFIGRDHELADVKNLLDQTHLLTLLGPGGTGKTRLMLQAAEDLIDQFPDGIWLVELAPVTDPDLIPDQVANVLRLREQPGRSMLDSLVTFLRRKELLLLLDNVEHLVHKSAELTEQLIKNCPKVKILITGREALFISGETTLQIPSLSLPEGEEQNLDSLLTSEAVQLFAARAQEVNPDFALSPDNAPAIVEIVQRLDGIPLALELAAARLRMLSVEQIASRLNDRFRLLTGGSRTALPRQQTLQALIDWSWNLLDESERITLRRLSVFSGGWRLSAAEEVIGDDQLEEASIFDLIDQLINKSLVVVNHLPGGEVRYRLLESIRQYARDRLFEAGEGEVLRDKHATYFAGFIDEVEARFSGEEMVPWLKRLIQETDNFRSALEWTTERNPPLMVEIAGKLFSIGGQGFWWFSPTQSRRWLEAAIEIGKDIEAPKEKAHEHQIHLGLAFTALSGVDFVQGRHEESEAAGRQAVALLRPTGDTKQLSYALATNAFAFIFSGQWELARVAGEEARQIALSNGHLFPLAMALGALTSSSMILGDIESVQSYLKESKTLGKDVENPWVNAQTARLEGRYLAFHGDFEQAQSAYELAEKLFWELDDRLQSLIAKSEVAHQMRRQGNLEAALPIYRDTILKFQDIGNEAAIAHQLECFGYIAITLDAPERAAKLLGSAQVLREKTNSPITFPWEKIDHDQAMVQMASLLGETTMEKVMIDGGMMAVDEAIAFARQDSK